MLMRHIASIEEGNAKLFAEKQKIELQCEKITDEYNNHYTDMKYIDSEEKVLSDGILVPENSKDDELPSNLDFSDEMLIENNEATREVQKRSLSILLKGSETIQSADQRNQNFAQNEQNSASDVKPSAKKLRMINVFSDEEAIQMELEEGEVLEDDDKKSHLKSEEEELILSDNRKEFQNDSIKEESNEETEENFRHTVTIFLVPTVPLVTQQANYIRSNSNLRTSQIWGGMRRVASHKVIINTKRDRICKRLCGRKKLKKRMSLL